MPKDPDVARRGGAARYRTIRIGKGKNRRTLHIAIVRKAGPRGGAAGQPHTTAD